MSVRGLQPLPTELRTFSAVIFRRICRTVRVEIRNCFHLDRNRECIAWFHACLGSSGKKNPCYDTAHGQCNHAGILWHTFPVQKNLKIVASVIVFIFLIPYTASLYNGLSRLFGMAFHIDYAVCILVMAVLTGIYVVAGGYMATAINDFLQGLIMLFGIVVVIAAVLKSNGGFLEALNGLANVEDAAASTQPGVFASFFGPDPFNLLCVVVLTSLGTWGLPQMVQKFYAIKSEASIKKGTIISTLFAVVVSGGCYFLGGFGRLYSSQIDIAADGYDAVIPAMLSNLPDLLIGLVVILVLSASMSTLSSLVMASSSTLTLDVLKDHVVKDMDEKKQVFIMRLLIVVFIAISVVIAIVQYKSNVTFIAQLMGVSWGALAGASLHRSCMAYTGKRQPGQPAMSALYLVLV